MFLPHHTAAGEATPTALLGFSPYSRLRLWICFLSSSLSCWQGRFVLFGGAECFQKFLGGEFLSGRVARKSAFPPTARARGSCNFLWNHSTLLYPSPRIGAVAFSAVVFSHWTREGMAFSRAEKPVICWVGRPLGGILEGTFS